LIFVGFLANRGVLWLTIATPYTKSVRRSE